MNKYVKNLNRIEFVVTYACRSRSFTLARASSWAVRLTFALSLLKKPLVIS